MVQFDIDIIITTARNDKSSHQRI